MEGQQTKFYAEPVNVLAGRLGLPQWLVDLRHEATHSQVRWSGEHRAYELCSCITPHTCTACKQLPSLSSLRMGAQQLLDWLFREYWQKQVCSYQALVLPHLCTHIYTQTPAAVLAHIHTRQQLLMRRACVGAHACRQRSIDRFPATHRHGMAWPTQARDLEQSSLMAARLLGEYKAVALGAQAESPNALSRACRSAPSLPPSVDRSVR